ncbi:calcium-binding protein [Microlunatus soli]|uniref:hypothetical protein n=1 Tax=Microlunatus soli TaxID=630515 RepID=UPI0015618C24|nr:hypothetical protein [Microlunatus soli]
MVVGLLITVPYTAITIAPAQAAATCNGQTVTQTVTRDAGSTGTDYGTDGDDVVLLNGTGEHDYDAKGGDDTICADVQDYSWIRGGDGDDWISARNAGSIVNMLGEAGDDVLKGSDSQLHGLGDYLVGGAGSDRITGGDGPDRIHGTISDTSDKVWAGPGDDTVHVPIAAAADFDLNGESGHDTLDLRAVDGATPRLDLTSKTITDGSGSFSGFQHYEVSGRLDVDGSEKPDHLTLVCTEEPSTINGNGGDDRIDVLKYGEGGDPTLDDQCGGHVINAGNGDDLVRLLAAASDVKVTLGPGADTATIYSGRRTTVAGGAGDDLFKVRSKIDGVPEAERAVPIDTTLTGGADDDTLSWDCESRANVADRRLACVGNPAKAGFGGMQIYRASRHDDVFRGGENRDTFYGGAGDDIMYGERGRDRLIGGSDTDRADGGPADDYCEAESKVRC